MKRCLIVFAKEPQRNEVKTRLKGCLSNEQRLELYKAFLKDTLNIAKRFKCESRILAFESAKAKPVYLESIGRKFKFYKQKGKDLGEKMHGAFRYAYRKKYKRIVIIGSDSPTLPSSFIRQAFKALNKNDAVLGPCRDGGFYLIGLKKPCFAIFKGIRWSSKTVFEDTLRNIKRLKKTAAVINHWYDVDEPNDLVRLKQDLEKSKNKNVGSCTKRYFRFCDLSHRQN